MNSDDMNAQKNDQVKEVALNSLPKVGAQVEKRPQLMLIHPALDYKGGLGYLTVKTWEEIDGDMKETQVMITSDRKRFTLPEKRGKRLGNLVIQEIPKLEEIDRWPSGMVQGFLSGSTVNPLLAFDEIKRLMMKYLELPDERQYALLSLWAMGTYVYQAFDAYGLIHLNGEKSCGKSKVLEVLEKLSFNGLMITSGTRAGVMRMVQKNRQTLLIDETEEFKSDRGQEIKTFLNGCYKRGGKYRQVHKESHEVEAYEIYVPVGIAGISELPETVASRAISIRMLRGKDKGRLNRVVTDDDVWPETRSMMYATALLYFKQIVEMNKVYTSDEITGRDFETFRPLLVIARFLDGLDLDRLDAQKGGLEDAILDYARTSIRNKKLLCGLGPLPSALLEILQEETRNGGITLMSKDISPKVIQRLGKDGSEIKNINLEIGHQLVRWGFEPGAKLHGYNRFLISPEKVNDIKERYDFTP